MVKAWIVALLLIPVLGTLAVAQGAPPLLMPADPAMERTIAAYLKGAHQVEFEAAAEENAPDDVTLIRTLKGEEAPEFLFFIKSAATADAPGTPPARWVVMGIIPQMKVPEAKRAAVLEAMNGLNDQNDYTHLYIDSDQEVAFRWAVLVPQAGLPATVIHDAYAGMLPAWEAAYKALSAALAE